MSLLLPLPPCRRCPGMSKKRGLSLDEKKVRLLEYMHEHKECYTLKELESSASKAKGIVSQSIKDVLGMLVADGLVDSDKIGAGNFFWALPSKTKVMAQQKLEKANKDLAAAKAKHAELEAKLAEMQAARPTSEKRAADLKRLAVLKAQAAELETEVGKFADCDPDRMKLLERGTEVCKAAANRWTDNLQTLIAQAREANPEATEAQLLEFLQLPKTLDYID